MPLEEPRLAFMPLALLGVRWSSTAIQTNRVHGLYKSRFTKGYKAMFILNKRVYERVILLLASWMILLRDHNMMSAITEC